MKQIITRNNQLKAVLIIYILFAVFASMQSLLSGTKQYHQGGREYNRYNNYIIFKQSYHHLIQDKDLYISYPEEHIDLFRYSPTFALFFGLFAYLPDAVGLHLWNLLNVLLLFFSLKYLPKLDDKQKAFMLLFVLAELFTSLKNEQSNPMIAGLIIFAFGLLERDKYLWATLCIVSTIYIKLFGIVAFALFIFYPKKWKLLAFSVLWLTIFLLMPLLAIDPGQFQFLYASWANQLANDHTTYYGYSVIGWLKTWFGIEGVKNAIVLSGVVLFCIPLTRIKYYQDYHFRLLALASVLIWVVIFNHKAESPTFIIAISGVAIWYFPQERTTLNLVLVIAAFIFTSLSPTDIFPRFIRNEYFRPYVVKAVPCIFVWLKIIYEMMFREYHPKL